MSSLFSALGQLAQSTGPAVEMNRKEDLAKLYASQQQQQLDIEKQHYQEQAAAKQREDVIRGLAAKRPYKLSEFNEGGKRYERTFFPETGTIRDLPGGASTDPLEAAKARYQQINGVEMPKELQNQFMKFVKPEPTQKIEMKQAPNGEWVGVPVKEGKSGFKGRLPKEGGAASVGASDPLIEKLAKAWHEKGIKPTAKFQSAVTAYMEDQGWEPARKMSASEQQVATTINQVKPKIDQLMSTIEKNNLQEQGSWVFGDHSALAQHLRMFAYQRGVKPEQVSADLIKGAAALQVMGASPWMRMGRGKYLYETVRQHLPSPTDTPQLLYDKLQFLKGIMDEAGAAIQETGSVAGTEAGEKTQAAPAGGGITISPDGSISLPPPSR